MGCLMSKSLNLKSVRRRLRTSFVGISELDCMFEHVLHQDRVLELTLVLTRNANKVVRLHAAGLLEHLNDGLLNLLVRVVDVDEDLLHGVGVERARPLRGQVVEEDLKGFACLDADTVLGVVETLQQLRIDLVEALTVHVLPHELHQLGQEHDGGEAQVVQPVVVEGRFKLVYEVW